jgi:hypothetical protein
MTHRNYGLRPDTRPVYEPRPPRHPRGELAVGVLALAGILCMAWLAAAGLHWLGGLL